MKIENSYNSYEIPDDYIFIVKKSEDELNDRTNQNQPGGSMYPKMDHFGMYPGQGMPYPPPQRNLQPQMSLETAGHRALHGVPFKLAPELSADTDTEISRYQVNELLSFMTNYEKDAANLDYDFKLERSLLND